MDKMTTGEKIKYYRLREENAILRKTVGNSKAI